MKIVNEHLNFPKARLVEPNTRGYIHLALEVEGSPIPLYFRTSRRKRDILKLAGDYAKRLAARDDVLNASVLKAAVKPPVDQPFLEEVRHKFHVAAYDVVILIETVDLDAASRLAREDVFLELKQAMEERANYTHCIVARNARRIGDVDRSRPGIFLFNYFFGENEEDTLKVWEYTAGWFTTNTGLDNSTLFQPAAGEESQYMVINHCRWDSLIRLMPKLLFMKTLDTYVMANFAANRTAVMPILYRLA